MDSVHFINLEYILVRAYDLVMSVNFNPAVVPHWVGATAAVITVVGLMLAFIFLILLVYAQIRLVQVEHAGFHAHEVHEYHEHEMLAHAPHNDRWGTIMQLAASPHESDWRRAILEADIMLSDALDARGWSGATVADQLRMSNPIQLTTLDLAWEAHKLRNQVAHQGEALNLSEREVRGAIDQYKRVLEELGAI